MEKGRISFGALIWQIIPGPAVNQTQTGSARRPGRILTLPAEVPPAPERDCAASQSRQREKPGPRPDLMAALNPTVLRLVFDRAALRGQCHAPRRPIAFVRVSGQ